MYGRRLIQKIRLSDFLSFGSEGEDIKLEPLNVIIGPNTSGKSNFIETFAIIRATPKDLTAPIREGGGASEWIWKGERGSTGAELETTVYYPEGSMPLRYRLSFSTVGQRFEVTDEAVENEHPNREWERDVYFFYRFQSGHPVLNVRTVPPDEAPGGAEHGRTQRHLRREDLDPAQSVLSQRKDPDQYPEITYLGDQFGKIRLYREWNLGRYTQPRIPQKTDLPEDFLLEDASNLGLVMNDLQHRGETRRVILENLRKFCDSVEDISTKIQGGTVQLFLHEKGLAPIPATRLSDGTLRYLCLLTILCHPEPPPLVCIEEPELGLHPYIIPTIAELLVDAAQRTQLVVTTHSDILVSALTDMPEAVLVAERNGTGTRLRRLEPEPLKEWLAKYPLGELWRMGEIGGTRW